MFKFDKMGSAGILTFVGDLRSCRISELKAALMLAVENVDHLFLNLEKVRTIDLPCFRVLYAAREKASALGKRLTLIGETNRPGTRSRMGRLSLKPV